MFVQHFLTIIRCTLMDLITIIHSHMRWIVLAAGLAAVLLPLPSVVGKKALQTGAKIMVRVFTIIASLQFLLGIVLLIGRWDDAGSMLRHRLEHGFCMLLAVGVLHMRRRFAKGPDPVIARNTFLVALTAVILILLGISVITMAKGTSLFG